MPQLNFELDQLKCLWLFN